jgi:DNA-3-methyladenine glycosylase I
MNRCAWPGTNPLMIAYHDTEWGVPVHNDRKLFEFMVLDAFQAGLSWAIVLKKREAFRAALHGFDAEQIARYSARDVKGLLGNEAIIRNKLKIEATISNAKALLALQEAEGSLDAYLWRFVGGAPRQNRWKTTKRVPARTRESDAMSEALKGRGFKFVGSTICYAFMQAAGMVNDHIVPCYRHAELGGLGT